MHSMYSIFYSRLDLQHPGSGFPSLVSLVPAWLNARWAQNKLRDVRVKALESILLELRRCCNYVGVWGGCLVRFLALEFEDLETLDFGLWLVESLLASGASSDPISALLTREGLNVSLSNLKCPYPSNSEPRTAAMSPKALGPVPCKA